MSSHHSVRGEFDPPGIATAALRSAGSLCFVQVPFGRQERILVPQESDGLGLGIKCPRARGRPTDINSGASNEKHV